MGSLLLGHFESSVPSVCFGKVDKPTNAIAADRLGRDVCNQLDSMLRENFASLLRVLCHHHSHLCHQVEQRVLQIPRSAICVLAILALGKSGVHVLAILAHISNQNLAFLR